MHLEALLTTWFGEMENGWVNDQHRRRWFHPDQHFDFYLNATFGGWLSTLEAASIVALAREPRCTLALIIACDQLPRNIYRGLPTAFAWDVLARTLARQGIAASLDRELRIDERTFFYMPFMHSESIDEQDLSVALFTRLRDETPAGFRHHSGGSLRSAMQHRDIIRQFDRFPQRNGPLNRSSTVAESEWLAKNFSSQSSTPHEA